ncbi:excinuclease ABC subunit UvrA [Aureibacter tunicatorum]|uniref:UvrABC system protein A n=1 Tax=Aureibacter tunicatorum TaxID=866807 RepID=A0AAE3XGJ5_9BACT|nr:excinuclease ABC subunit UvrA [Aureibacter tunicatorum]MDR6237216.1 excinuclease ABC subunit A [Aureibacter tunicatorum]BDD06208.1 UvrABC system protein A [Aureibacter tunicatorum]
MSIDDNKAVFDQTGFDNIEIYGAREHNLKNIDIKIPRNELVVLTGISGSGKSSIAFDTIYAEGQRRYMESFSAYARSFMGGMERPDVDKINGLSPVISIEQKTTSKNPRSTVGTTTEVYDFMRLLFARAGEAYSYITGNKMVRQSEDQIVEQVFQTYANKKLVILAPVVKGRKGHYRELFEQLRKNGFSKVRVDGEVQDLIPKMQLDRYKIHDVEIVIDRVKVGEKDRFRISQSIKTALNHGEGLMMVLDEGENLKYFSKILMDPETGLAYDEPAPNTFSFNSPYGACPTCNGLGVIEEFTIENVIPDFSKSISQGAIEPLGEYRDIWIFKKIESFLKKHDLNISTPVEKFPKKILEKLMSGSGETVSVASVKYPGTDWNTKFDGVFDYLYKQKEAGTEKMQKWVNLFLSSNTCPDCNGARLKKESLHIKVAEKNIAELSQMDLKTLLDWFDSIDDKLSNRQKRIASEVLKEIKKRVGFLVDVGLHYLNIDRPVKTLSGGEAQRIRLATQIGTQLVGVLYILDEPSIGLHQRDNVKLIKALEDLRDLGNSVIVVEHDKDMMLAADHVIDIGPGAGIHGGRIVASGSPAEFVKQGSMTAKFLNGEVEIEVPKERRKGNGHELMIGGITGNNLKNVDLKLPLGKMVCVTGVSGSGKSTMIHETLYPILNAHFYKGKKVPMPYKKVEGLEYLDKVIEVDQSPIGRTPRSNPATYTGVFTEIRSLFSELPEAKIRGYKPGRFSFNVKGGRCETCQGAGKQVVEMDFLPDVLVDCEECKGKRYNRETLEVRYKGKSISDVLEMTVESATDFFENHPKIIRKIRTLNDVGLGYVTLGQHATTLSGGEAQRVKLATELSKKDTGKTMYILDEPTTGLHFQDILHLLKVIEKLVDKGNTVVVIEHNLDVIKMADHIIDMGPEGGSNGGEIVFEGTPEQLVSSKKGYTAKFLKEEL